MNFYADHADGIAELQAELGSDCPMIYYRGALIKCLPGDASRGGKNEVGGISLDCDLTVTCLAADFTAVPKSSQPFKYPGQDGNNYNIVAVQIAPGGLQYTITANDANQGV